MAAVAVTSASIYASTTQLSSSTDAAYFTGFPLLKYCQKKRKSVKISGKVSAAATAAVAAPAEEVKEYILPKWAEFDLGRAPIYWKTMNGLPPTSGEKLKLFYNPAATKLAPNDEFGIAFNGGFNQPIMCGGEPRQMLCKTRGKADPPIYIIQICIPKHAMNLIFSFTNGTEWDGPYRLQFQVPKNWRSKPVDFFNEGLAEELSREGACEKAIFPDANIIIDRCAMIGNLTLEGGDRCELDLVVGCTDPGSSLYDPLANVDDGSCPLSDSGIGVKCPKTKTFKTLSDKRRHRHRHPLFKIINSVNIITGKYIKHSDHPNIVFPNNTCLLIIDTPSCSYPLPRRRRYRNSHQSDHSVGQRRRVWDLY